MYQSIKKYFSVLAITLLVSTPGTAGTLTLDLTNQFSNDPPLSTAGPYGTVFFDDGGTSGSVTMTFTYYGDNDGTPLGKEGDKTFLSELYINFSGGIAPNNLTITPFSGDTGSFAGDLTGDQYRADGDGFYDILFNFKTANSDNRLTAGDMVVFSITGGSIDAADFNFLSSPGPGSSHGPFYAAGHIQGLPGGASAWVAAVPLPGALVLLLSGVLGLGLTGRKRKQHQAAA